MIFVRLSLAILHCLLLASAWLLTWGNGQVHAADAMIITDTNEVARYVSNFNAKRRLPDTYRIVFHIDRLDNGMRHWRVDEWVRAGENMYWKREYQGRPGDPVVRKETLVMPGPNSQILAWETNQPMEPADTRHRPTMPETPTGNVTFEAGKASDVRLQIEGERALLNYRETHSSTDGGDISRSYELDLKAGVFKEGKSIYHGRGNSEEHRRTEIFDTAPQLGPDYFQQIRERLIKGEQQTARNTTLLQQANFLALLLGALLPIALSFAKYLRALRPKSLRHVVIGATAFFVGVPVLLTLSAQMLAGKELLVMFLFGIPWALVGNVLPRELALPVSQFVTAALVTSIPTAIVALVLHQAVIRRQATPREPRT